MPIIHLLASAEASGRGRKEVNHLDQITESRQRAGPQGAYPSPMSIDYVSHNIFKAQIFKESLTDRTASVMMSSSGKSRPAIAKPCSAQ